jgi:hypothetical protein
LPAQIEKSKALGWHLSGLIFGRFLFLATGIKKWKRQTKNQCKQDEFMYAVNFIYLRRHQKTPCLVCQGVFVKGPYNQLKPI